ncbi:unnamed protein product [Pleuronectes platessa]|uniref:Uncharacterized protein n=1 Tax=Pleuronectes platessa TaxID=8262 RepID=A0A9N7V8A4_PLEPL|nr:unnamed protein product [Pleuronectes platessa]
MNTHPQPQRGESINTPPTPPPPPPGSFPPSFLPQFSVCIAALQPDQLLLIIRPQIEIKLPHPASPFTPSFDVRPLTCNPPRDHHKLNQQEETGLSCWAETETGGGKVGYENSCNWVKLEVCPSDEAEQGVQGRSRSRLEKESEEDSG